jgi:hypothetical protein
LRLIQEAHSIPFHRPYISFPSSDSNDESNEKPPLRGMRKYGLLDLNAIGKEA